VTTGFIMQSQCRFEIAPSIARALVFRTKGTQTFLIRPRNLGLVVIPGSWQWYELETIITHRPHIRL